MINFINGKLVEKSSNLAIIENNGIGYNLNISGNTFQSLPQNGSEVRLLTYLYVREDQLTLYGFAGAEERNLFLTLISISGIGAKGALKILSGISPRRFAEVVAAEDVAFLTRLPGIGKKSAQRIIVELREKLPALTDKKEALPGIEKESVEEVINALGSLGLSGYESRKALEKLVETIGAEKARALSTEEMIREVFKVGR